MGVQLAPCTPNSGYAGRLGRSGRSGGIVSRTARTGCSLAGAKRMPRMHETACSNHATLTKPPRQHWVRLGLISPERQITVGGGVRLPGRGPKMCSLSSLDKSVRLRRGRYGVRISEGTPISDWERSPTARQRIFFAARQRAGSTPHRSANYGGLTDGMPASRPQCDRYA